MALGPSSTPFPDILAPKEEKAKKEYGLAYAKAIWGERIMNQNTFDEFKRQYLINREYAEGLQSIQRYKDRKNITDTSYLNLDFRPVNIIATTVDNIVGKLSKIDYRVTCTPLDPESKNEKDEYRNRLKANRFLKKISDELEPLTGMPLVDKSMGVPETDEEEEIYMQMNFKWASSVAMEIGLNFVHTANDFPQVKERVIRDLVENKISAIRTCYDEDYNITYKRVDFIDLIVPRTHTEDFKNMNQFGLLNFLTVGEIAKKGNFSKKELFDIAKLNEGRFGNRRWEWGTSYDSTYFRDNGSVPQWYSFNIWVMDFEFLALDGEYREFKSVKRRKYWNDLSSYKVGEVDGEVVSKEMRNRYEGSWIVGTDHLISYGKSKNIPRERIAGSYSPDTCLSLSVISPNLYQMKNKSHVERMIPHEDQINLAHLGLQIFLVKAKPPGVAVDVRGLIDAAEGMGHAGKPIEILKMYQETGNLVYSSSDEQGDVVNSKVVTELSGGVGNALKDFLTVYQFERQMINEVVGYNSAVDASSPPANALVGVQQNAIEATNNSLAPLFNAHLRLINKANKLTSLMIQDCVEHNNQAFVNALGAHATAVLEQGKNMAFIQMGIDIELLPDENEKLEINEQIRLAQQSNPPLLTPSNVIRIRQAMKENTKLAAQLLDYFEKKNRKDRMEESAMLQKQNGDIQVQSAQAATQGAIQSDNAMTENKAKLVQLEAQLKAAQSAQDFAQQKELLMIQLQAQGAKTQADNATKLEVQDKVNEGKLAEQRIDQRHEESMSEKEHDQNISQEAFKSLVNKKKDSDKK